MIKRRAKKLVKTGRQRPLPEAKASSPSPYSYSSRRSEDAVNVGRGETPKQKITRNATSGKRKAVLIISLIILALIAIKLLSLSSTPVIKIAGSTSNNALINKNSASVYANAASKYLSGSILNSNKITLDSEGLVSYLSNKFPELSSVRVSLPFLANQLLVYVIPSQPAIILIESSSSYAIDQTGRAILSASSPQALGLSLPVVTDHSGLNVALGKKAITSNDVYFIEEVVGQLQVKGFKATNMSLPANSDELDVGVVGQPFYIKFNLYNNDPRQQAGTFLAVINKLKSENITPSKYVDVRVDGRAYYQ